MLSYTWNYLPMVTVCSQESADTECPEYWYKYNGACYMLHHPKMSFADAEAFCATVQPGSTLAAVPDYAALAQAVPLDAEYFWIGLRSTPDIQGELRWLNADGDRVADTNWQFISYDEPNGPATGPENDCVMLNGLQSEELYAVGEWGDYKCDFESRFLCAVEV